MAMLELNDEGFPPEKLTVTEGLLLEDLLWNLLGEGGNTFHKVLKPFKSSLSSS